MDDKGDMRMRVIAQLGLAIEENAGLDEPVQAAFMAEVKPYVIGELSGLPMRRVLQILGRPGD